MEGLKLKVTEFSAEELAEKGQIRCIYTGFPWSSIPSVCAVSYLCEVVSSGVEKEATCLP